MNKKSQDIKTFVDVFLSVIIVGTVVGIVFLARGVGADTSRADSDLLVHKTFNSRCFSESFGTFLDSKFTEGNFDFCFENFDFEGVGFMLKIGETEFVKNSEIVQDSFTNCEIRRNYCVDMEYPIFLEKDGLEPEIELLELKIVFS